jgi:hypothetical protein
MQCKSIYGEGNKGEEVGGLEEKYSLDVVYVFCVNEKILSRDSSTVCLKDSCVGNM